MTRLYLICGLLILISCNSELDDEDFKDKLESLEKINSKLLTLDNLDTLNKNNSLELVTGILKEDTVDLFKLKRELELKDIKYYKIGGLEYKFGTGKKNDYQYYMVYSIDPETREEYLSYEQYLDFKIKRTDFSDRWTFIKIQECN